MITIKDALIPSYPGRGIIVGENEKGNAIIAYFLTGRSVNSRNRVFVRGEDGLRTKAFDESNVSDPSLIIYRPYAKVSDTEIITNGDQTETIIEYLSKGGSFEDALRTRTYEPDAPNFTPRISAIVRNGEKTVFELSILRKGEGENCARSFYTYAGEKGVGYFIRTYVDNGEPLPSFVGPPIKVVLKGDADTIANVMWQSLPEENKVSLFVREDSPSGKEKEKIINKLEL